MPVIESAYQLPQLTSDSQRPVAACQWNCASESLIQRPHRLATETCDVWNTDIHMYVETGYLAVQS